MDFGFKTVMDTLTTFGGETVEQSHYLIRPTEYLPHTAMIGDANKWAENVLDMQVIHTGGNPELGVIHTGSSYVKARRVDAKPINVRSLIGTWDKEINWSFFEVSQALASRNFEFIKAKFSALKKDWELLIQQTMFLGLKKDKDFTGLLNSTGITKDTTTITRPLSKQEGLDKLNEIIIKMLTAYMKNTNETEYPNILVVPSIDYQGMTTLQNTISTALTVKEIIEKAFSGYTTQGFKILPCAYSNKDRLVKRDSTLTKDRYVLYRYDSSCIKRHIPFDFTIFPPNTADNVNYNQRAYGRFGQVSILKPKTIMYFDSTN